MARSKEQELENAETRTEWRASQVRTEFREGRSHILVVALLVVLLFLVGIAAISQETDRSLQASALRVWLYICGLAEIVVLLVGVFYYYSKRKAFIDSRRVRIARDALQKAEAEVVKETPADQNIQLAALWQLTQNRIDYYHDVAMDHARKSFASSRFAAISGLAVLAAVAVAAALSNSTAGAVAAGAVGVTAGALNAFVTATFMRTQTEAANQLQKFFIQPVEFSRILGAERLIKDLPSRDKVAAIQQIMKSLMPVPTSTEVRAEEPKP